MKRNLYLQTPKIYDLIHKRKEKIMTNRNILCCINENPLFSYSPISNESFPNLEQVIINYITRCPSSKKWLKKEKTIDENVEFLYYEINIEKAYTHLTKGRKYRYNTIENFCLSFLNFFLEETPDKLIEFLKTTDSFTEEELDDIRAYFTTCAKAKVSSNCKKTGNPKKNYSMA